MSSVIQLSYSTIGLIVSVFIALYYYLNSNLNYWSSRGVNGPKPLPLIGNILSLFKKSLAEYYLENLQKYGNIHGLFLGSKPVLVVAEPQLIKDILVKDFSKFVNTLEQKVDDPVLGRMLPFEMNEDWKKLRSVISPTYSTGKIKKMHGLVDDCVHPMDKKLENVAQNEKEIELKKLIGDYTADVIASCAFATKIDTHNDPNNPFVKNASNTFAHQSWRLFLLVGFKQWMKVLNISIIPLECFKFFKSAIEEISRKREQNKSEKHNDFLELMLNAKNREESDTNDVEEMSNDFESHHVIEHSFKPIDYKNKIRLTNDQFIANSVMFFVVGYETVTNLLSHLIYQLAINPETQQKLFEEILKCIEEKGGLDYESISRLPYLDACISETLRMNNPISQTNRVASEDYALGQTGITITKGMTIIIPIHAIHNSSKFYPNPQQFDPNRFVPENREKIIPFTYLPFGAGPRNCVGMRFALMEAKTAIARLIPKYKFFRTKKTKIPLKYCKFDIQLIPYNITIGVELRNSQK